MKFSRAAARKVRGGTREFPGADVRTPHFRAPRTPPKFAFQISASRTARILASAFIGSSRLAVLPLARDGGL
jgi:hypothetical protein